MLTGFSLALVRNFMIRSTHIPDSTCKDSQLMASVNILGRYSAKNGVLSYLPVSHFVTLGVTSKFTR